MLVNSSIPGLSKVGRTTRPPLERAAELSAATGVATPFVLAFEQEFADCCAAERCIHAELERRGWRVSAAREFFRGPASEIVRVVLETAAESGDGVRLPVAASAEALLTDGDRHLLGHGETLQDVTEAVRCYRLAAARGSLVAVERIGAMYAQLAAATPVGRRRAMRVLKDGARRGNYYCLVEMAELYAEARHFENFAKAWALFFSRRGEARCEEVERGLERYVVALRRYIGGCLALQLAPLHVSEMRPEAEALTRSLLASLDAMRDAPEARQHIVAVLHWTYANLLPASPAPAASGARSALADFVAWLRRPRRAAA